MFLEKDPLPVMRNMAKKTVEYCIDQGKLESSHEKKNLFIEDKNPLLQKLHHYFRRKNGKRGKWKLHDSFDPSTYGKVRPVKPEYKIRPYHKGKHFGRHGNRLYKV